MWFAADLNAQDQHKSRLVVSDVTRYQSYLDSNIYREIVMPAPKPKSIKINRENAADNHRYLLSDPSKL